MEIDFHVHSKYSFDSIMEPKNIIKIAKKKNLNAIAITDHNTIKGSIVTKNFVKDNSDFQIIIGAEISSDIGDIIGLFLTDEIISHKGVDVIKEIRNQGGISVLAHPFKRNSKISNEIIEKIDAIEVFNARGNSFICRNANYKAIKFAKGLNKPFTAGSDAHLYFEVGRGRCILNCDYEDIRDTILSKKKVKISGFESSLFIEPWSQTIKIIKTSQYISIYPLINELGCIIVGNLKTRSK